MKKQLQVIFGLLFLFTLSVSSDMPSPPPPGPMGAYLNGVFPETSPNSKWELEDLLPSFTFKSPLRLVSFSDSEDYLLLCKSGEIWKLSFENQTRERVLDIRDITLDRSEAGLIGMALHPDFGDPSVASDKQEVFVFYRSKPEPEIYEHPGYNILSKFKWNVSSGTFNRDSEEILIQQYDRNAWHNGGGMFFGNDGFLYLSLGDEGILPGYPDHVLETTQRIDNGLFSGVIRIDVDNDMSRSHPIRRQPKSPEEPPAGWEGTFTQGYSIPNDNPWLDPNGGLLEEFYAIGIRSPFSMTYDPVEDMIWLADVGTDRREEVTYIEKGDNLQWPYKEGSTNSWHFVKPEDLIGNEKPPIYEYPRSEGTCIMGGGVYHGDKFPELKGKYLFTDWVTNVVQTIPIPSMGQATESEVLIDNIQATNLDMLPNPGITGIIPSDDGEVLFTVMDLNQSESGKIYQLVGRVETPQALGKLSELGAFTDLENLTPAPGIIPYEVNSPLWSDRALKKRWMALPNDGAFDSPGEKIGFTEKDEWDFPPGTVFIKHFDLPLTTDPNGEIARLETRFFIVDKNGQGYGLTYQWNDEGTEAYLLEKDASKEFEITESGAPAFTQTWEYPSPSQCLSCHTDAADYVLGVKTVQLNSEIEYPSLGTSMNQLDYLNEHGVFNREIRPASNYAKAAHIEDENADLEWRVRSYLDSNCSSCHRPGGVSNLKMDLRSNIPLSLQNIINVPTQSLASDKGRFLVEPGSHATSEVWVRDASDLENRMPPIGQSIVDEVYIEALTEWIDGLPEDAGTIKKVLIYPNPVQNLLSIRINDEWAAPFGVKVYATSGQLLFQDTGEDAFMQVDMEYLPHGTYFIEVSDGSNREVKKFVKL